MKLRPLIIGSVLGAVLGRMFERHLSSSSYDGAGIPVGNIGNGTYLNS